MPRRSEESNDIAIIDQVISGDVNAFEVLLERYEAYVFSIVRRRVPAAEADEVAQDIFIRTYQGLPGFSGKGSFKQWLSGISERACYDFWRKRYRSKEVPMRSLTDEHREYLENKISGDAFRSFEEEERRTEDAEIIGRVFNKLSAAERMVLELVYFEGYSHKETAALLGWSVANIKIRAHRARKKIYKLLKAEKNIRGHHGTI